MNQKECAKYLGISLSGLAHKNLKELSDLGVEKVGKGKGCYYKLTKGAVVASDDIATLKIAKLQQEIELLKYKNQSGEREIIERFIEGTEDQEGYKAKLLKALAPLRDAYADAKLTEEQSKIINLGMDKILENIRSGL